MRALLVVAVLSAHASAGPCGQVQRRVPQQLPWGSAGGLGTLGGAPVPDRPADAGAVYGLVPGNDFGNHVELGANAKTIAPGLYVVPLANTAASGKPPPVLPAPRVVSASAQSSDYPFFMSGASAKLAAKVPAGAIAVVVFGVDKTGTTPRSWTAAPSGSEIALYGSSGKCTESIPGEIPTSAGDRIAIAWLDKWGRLGKMSSPFTVGK